MCVCARSAVVVVAGDGDDGCARARACVCMYVCVLSARVNVRMSARWIMSATVSMSVKVSISARVCVVIVYCLQLFCCMYGRHTCLDIAFLCSFGQRASISHFIGWPARRYRQTKMAHTRDMQVCQSHVHAPNNQGTSISSKLIGNSLNQYRESVRPC